MVVKWYKKKTGKTHGAQAAFAEKTKTDAGLLSRYITGIYVPGPDILEKYAKELGVSIEELMACFTSKYPSSGTDKGSRIREGGSAEYASPPQGLMPIIGTISGDPFQLDLDGPAVDALPLPATGKHFAIRVEGAGVPGVAPGQCIIAARTSVVPHDKGGIYHVAKGYTIRAPGAGGALKAAAVIIGLFVEMGL